MNNIAVAGNQWITKFLIEKLIVAGLKPNLIINLNVEKSEDISGYFDLSEIAEKNNIALYRPIKYSLKSKKDKEVLSSKKIDILIVFGWQRLIPSWLLDLCTYGAYGVHGGPELPPRARGRAVFNWAILLGYKKFYHYLFKLDPNVDSGEIIDINEFEILDSDDIISIYHKNCIISSEMFIKYIPEILKNSLISTVKQQNTKATYLPKRIPQNSGICWNERAETIINLIRAVRDPYPSAFTYLDEERIEILRAHIFDKKLKFENKEIGKIIEVFPNMDFIVKTADFPIYIREYNILNPNIIRKGKIFKICSGIQVSNPII